MYVDRWIDELIGKQKAVSTRGGEMVVLTSGVVNLREGAKRSKEGFVELAEWEL